MQIRHVLPALRRKRSRLSRCFYGVQGSIPPRPLVSRSGHLLQGPGFAGAARARNTVYSKSGWRFTLLDEQKGSVIAGAPFALGRYVISHSVIRAGIIVCRVVSRSWHICFRFSFGAASEIFHTHPGQCAASARVQLLHRWPCLYVYGTLTRPLPRQNRRRDARGQAARLREAGRSPTRECSREQRLVESLFCGPCPTSPGRVDDLGFASQSGLPWSLFSWLMDS